jgi:hypothetical protein
MFSKIQDSSETSFVKNFKMQHFLHFLEEQTPKKMWPKNKFKMAAKFKMVTKTKFAYVAKKTLARLGQFD